MLPKNIKHEHEDGKLNYIHNHITLKQSLNNYFFGF